MNLGEDRRTQLVMSILVTSTLVLLRIFSDHLKSVQVLKRESGVQKATERYRTYSSRLFTYVTAHSPTLPSLYLRRSSFSSPSVTSPTSQLNLQPFFRFSYVTGSSLTSLGEPPMLVRDKCTCYVIFSKER